MTGDRAKAIVKLWPEEGCRLDRRSAIVRRLTEGVGEMIED
jgi:hypothetical protein